MYHMTFSRDRDNREANQGDADWDDQGEPDADDKASAHGEDGEGGEHGEDGDLRAGPDGGKSGGRAPQVQKETEMVKLMRQYIHACLRVHHIVSFRVTGASGIPDNAFSRY